MKKLRQRQVFSGDADNFLKNQKAGCCFRLAFLLDKGWGRGYNGGNMEKIRKLLAEIKKRGLYPDVKVMESAPTPEVIILSF